MKETIAPADLVSPDPDDRRFAGALTFGLHTRIDDRVQRIGPPKTESSRRSVGGELPKLSEALQRGVEEEVADTDTGRRRRS